MNVIKGPGGNAVIGGGGRGGMPRDWQKNRAGNVDVRAPVKLMLRGSNKERHLWRYLEERKKRL